MSYSYWKYSHVCYMHACVIIYDWFPRHPNHIRYKRHCLAESMSFVVDVVPCETLDSLGFGQLVH